MAQLRGASGRSLVPPRIRCLLALDPRDDCRPRASRFAGACSNRGPEIEAPERAGSEIVTDCDICVIGAGSGGLTVAAAAAQFGRDVVLIERGKMGGDCLNYGCVPSKAVIAAARRAQAMREATPFGIGSVEPQIDFAAVLAHVKNTIAAIAPKD